MRQRDKSLTKGGWRAIALSILLHGGIVAAAVYGWFTWKHSPPPPTTMAIEGSVIDERALKGIDTPPKPAPLPEPEPEPEPVPEPEPPPPEEQGPPKPDPAEVERKQEEERLAREKQEQERQEQQKREQERLEQERIDAEKQAAAKAAAEKAAAEKAAAEKRAAEKKKAEEEAAAKKAADERARQAREAELRRSLEAEERVNALRRGPEAQRWIAQISAKIARAWVKPAAAQPGVECLVTVRQVQGGDVTSAEVNRCNVDDQALRDSVLRAVYNASPLPPPPDPALFQPTLVITFAPER